MSMHDFLVGVPDPDLSTLEDPNVQNDIRETVQSIQFAYLHGVPPVIGTIDNQVFTLFVDTNAPQLHKDIYDISAAIFNFYTSVKGRNEELEGGLYIQIGYKEGYEIITAGLEIVAKLTALANKVGKLNIPMADEIRTYATYLKNIVDSVALVDAPNGKGRVMINTLGKIITPPTEVLSKLHFPVEWLIDAMGRMNEQGDLERLPRLADLREEDYLGPRNPTEDLIAIFCTPQSVIDGVISYSDMQRRARIHTDIAEDLKGIVKSLYVEELWDEDDFRNKVGLLLENLNYLVPKGELRIGNIIETIESRRDVLNLHLGKGDKPLDEAIQEYMRYMRRVFDDVESQLQSMDVSSSEKRAEQYVQICRLVAKLQRVLRIPAREMTELKSQLYSLKPET